MKKIILLLIPILSMMGLHAENIVGSTFHQYSKPGAPIEMTYSSKRVDINETSDVNITLTATVNHGKMFASIHLDDELNSIEAFDNNLSLTLQENQQSLIIHLKVNAKKAGLYYVKLLTKIDKGYGIKLRSFAVPIYVGEQIKKPIPITELQMKAAGNGENISISTAVETIEVLKSK